MVESYRWTRDDFCLNPLPLNHYSGLVYCLLTPFFVGASTIVLSKFDAHQVWQKLLDQNSKNIESKLNVFIAVPTIYTQLVQAYFKNQNGIGDKFSPDLVRETLRSKMRIIASGSAPLSVKTFEDWQQLTEFPILERYGMTEIGMSMSTSYEDTSKRIGGTIGRPCGSNRCRVYDNTTDSVLLESDAQTDTFLNDSEKKEQIFGELLVKGPNVFTEYFNKPNETRKCFTSDGWFKTGKYSFHIQEERKPI